MSKQTKLTDISPKVKKEVWQRDEGRCVVCGSSQAMPNAHVFVNRSHGGLGIKENVATLCIKCHHDYDNGKNKEHEYVKSILHEYMFKLYPDLDISKLSINTHKTNKN